MNGTVTKNAATNAGVAVIAGTLGLCFAYTSMSLFIYNQKKYVRNFQKLQHTSKTCRSVSQPSPTNENKLVCVADEIVPSDTVADDLFQISFNSKSAVIYLYRETEIYQWKETQSKTNNKYTKIWSSEFLDSSTFAQPGHVNPTSIIQSKLFHSKRFSVSKFEIVLNEHESIAAPGVDLRSTLLGRHAQLFKHGDVTLIADGSKGAMRSDHSRSGWYYFGSEVAAEHSVVGDMRVRFWIVAQPLQMTVLGIQNGNTINTTKNGFRCIGAYSVDTALKKLYHVQSVTKDTGSIFVMTNFAFICSLYALQWLKPLLAQAKPKTENNRKTNLTELGLKSLVASTSICAPVFTLSILYPQIAPLYSKHAIVLNSIMALSVASLLVIGGTKTFKTTARMILIL